MTTGWIRPKRTMPGSVTMARSDRPVRIRIWAGSEVPPNTGAVPAAVRGAAGRGAGGS